MMLLTQPQNNMIRIRTLKYSLNGCVFTLLAALSFLLKCLFFVNAWQPRLYRLTLIIYTYCYAKENGQIRFNTKNNKTKAALTHMYIDLVISKPTTTSV